MSCHDIGRGMNSVVKTTITLMDSGKLSKDVAKEIIISCAKGVGWCDGNESEAIDYIRKCMCGRCMKLIPKGEKLYSLYHVSFHIPYLYHLNEPLASPRLCEECFDIVLNELNQDENAGKRERAYIESKYKTDDYTSTGEYNPYNNGCLW